MAKTKTFEVRPEHETIAKLERLKDRFDFASYGDMKVRLVRHLKEIDEVVCGISEPSGNGARWIAKYLFSLLGPAISSDELSVFTWWRLRNRFGENGVQRIQELFKGLE
jgi:hypothetical protein